MIELRPFLNSDSPGIASVWCSQRPLRGRLPRLTTDLLEQYILSKPYFEPRGLLVAEENRRVIGFAHVGFPLKASRGELNHCHGIVCMLQVAPRTDGQAIADRLLEEAETRLRDAGAQELFGGGVGVHAPFYLGIYGGSRLPGVLVGDTLMSDALRRTSYAEFRQVSIWQRDLATFRPPVDRELVALRRQFTVQTSNDLPIGDWCDDCAFSWSEPLRFTFASASTGATRATLTFWDIEPLAHAWGGRAMGLAEGACGVETHPTGLFVFCLAEALRHLQRQGVSLVEVQTDAADFALAEACRKLTFREVDHGIQFQKKA